MRKQSAIIALLLLAACGQAEKGKRKLDLSQKGEVQVLVTGAGNISQIKEEAQLNGVTVTGDAVLVLKGDAESINNLSFLPSENFDFVVDEQIDVEKPEAFAVNTQGLYQAKKDFGILNFWKKHPEADGRGVKVGVIDDGISPHQAGLMTTSTGERKLLKKESPSSFTTFALTETEEGLVGVVDETRPAYGGKVDLNANGKFETFKILVPAGTEKICLDLNLDNTMSEDECKGSFSKTGEYHIAVDNRLALMSELDVNAKKVKILQPESGGDSHGEGVASVLAAHALGGVKGFDGVAPGSQILDYDLSELSDSAIEHQYTLGTFLKAIEWLGSEGVEVANVSYSLFYTSAKTQNFMSKALNEIVNKYNMVVSFSAGNNGPGLGSLNRRGIYPPSILVAGAYISPELDERVHGVTGIPEEGRVVYYSSRGPGLGVGPTLLSPLSSLTASTPTETFRAFNGTSSASPALAGAAAVLISAIKQEGLPYKAATAVAALKLSGRQLKNEPYIFQGHGLPQVAKALEIYRDLIAGNEFEDVKVTIDRGNIDGLAVSGVTILKSASNEVETRSVRLTGVTSALAPTQKTINLLAPVRLEMSKGLTGPRELWVASSTSSFAIDINPEEVLSGKLEGFGEIKVISLLTNRLLAVVPVTVVNDLDVRTNPKVRLNVGAQEGVRIPLDVPEGVTAFRVKSRVVSGDERSLITSVFNDQQIRTTQQRIGNDLIVNVSRAGFYQIGLSMSGGTARRAEVEFEIEEIRLRNKTKVASSEKPSIKILNETAPTSFRVDLVSKRNPIIRKIFSSKDLKTAGHIERKFDKGNYSVAVRSLDVTDLQYLYTSCTVNLIDSKNVASLRAAEAFTVTEDGTEAKVRCVPFDEGAKFEEETSWEISIFKEGPTQSIRTDWSRGQTRVFNFNKAEPGVYEIRATDPLSGSAISLGEIELI